jgi:hypothetical protein
MRKSLVITSISSPNNVLKTYAKLCKKSNIHFIVIGDTKSPDNFELEACDFWNIDRQKKLKNSFVDLVPYQHYARKNIGYLIAIQNGADIIIETDDDNLPCNNFLNFYPKQLKAQSIISKNQWLNIYEYFSAERIWPRGFSLEHILNGKKGEVQKEQMFNCPIQQGLADENPDVDAMYRLSYPLPINFKPDLKYVLDKNTWCPFNSQNTVWYKEAFMLMYLPAYCSFRMTDIWRSFVAQRIAWENNWNILFYSPTVWQERNEHNLLKDFEEEIPGYLNNHKIVNELQNLQLKSGVANIPDNLLKCYDKLIAMQLVDGNEMNLLKEWIKQF